MIHIEDLNGIPEASLASGHHCCLALRGEINIEFYQSYFEKHPRCLAAHLQAFFPVRYVILKRQVEARSIGPGRGTSGEWEEALVTA